jgi:hypothetical protein
MMICHVQDPKQRATARDVETILKQKMRELDPGQLEKWGLS